MQQIMSSGVVNWGSSIATVTPRILYRRIHRDSIAPMAPAQGDAGYDLIAQENISLARGESRKIGTGIAFAIPADYAGLVLGRSGNAFNRSLFVSHIGLIDSNYRGEVFALLRNDGNSVITISRGDAFAQLVIVPIITYRLEEARALDETSRGEQGFGSSGMVGRA